MKRDTLFRECIAEAIGIFFILFLGAGSVASLTFLGNYDSFWELSVMWGIAVALGIYVAGGVSGAHLNPAVTIVQMVFRGFPGKKVIPYIISQIVGAFAGAAAAYGLFRHNFLQWELENGVVRGTAASQDTAGIFTTYPQSYLGNIDALVIEFAITAVFIMVILAVSDNKNTAAPGSGMGPVIIGATIAVIGGTFGGLTGFALNPARDLGPKLFLAISGWGEIGFPGPNAYFWVPIVGPILGALAGALIYQVCIHKTLVTLAEPVEEKVTLPGRKEKLQDQKEEDLSGAGDVERSYG